MRMHIHNNNYHVKSNLISFIELHHATVDRGEKQHPLDDIVDSWTKFS